MPIWKLQCSLWNDSVLARDAFVITPHFNDQGVGSNPQQLCTDLAAALHTWAGSTHQITVKAYDAQGSQPVYPAGSTTINVGGAPTSSCPREIALCLSFFSANNIKRQRGRLYVPAPIFAATVGVRPSDTYLTKVGALAPIFAGLGGVDVDWCIWSRLDGVARPVTNWWVDDEWDTVRSRGLKATKRTVGVTTEA